jgi:hypothetical protein
VEYLNYILIILGIMAVCILLIRIPGQKRLKGDKVALSDRARNHREQKQVSRAEERKQKKHDQEVLNRELSKVSTPWGWPGHNHTVKLENSLEAQEVHGFSESLHRFVDKLVAEKKTVDNEEYMLRKNDSLRSMVEDRYGRANKMSELEYRKVKAPLLRDPSQPHDQMDNFPDGKVDGVESKLSSQPESTRLRMKLSRLREVRKPWGW